MSDPDDTSYFSITPRAKLTRYEEEELILAENRRKEWEEKRTIQKTVALYAFTYFAWLLSMAILFPRSGDIVALLSFAAPLLILRLAYNVLGKNKKTTSTWLHVLCVMLHVLVLLLAIVKKPSESMIGMGVCTVLALVAVMVSRLVLEKKRWFDKAFGFGLFALFLSGCLLSIWIFVYKVGSRLWEWIISI